MLQWETHELKSPYVSELRAATLMIMAFILDYFNYFNVIALSLSSLRFHVSSKLAGLISHVILQVNNPALLIGS